MVKIKPCLSGYHPRPLPVVAKTLSFSLPVVAKPRRWALTGYAGIKPRTFTMEKAQNIVEAKDLKPLQHAGHTFNKALVDTFTEPNSAKINTLTAIRGNEGLVVEAVIKGKNEQI